MTKTTLLTHVSYDSKGENPYIGSALPLSSTLLPDGRMTGVFGRTDGSAATTYWWKKIDSLYGKPLSKVEIYIEDNGVSSNNQSIAELPGIEILNILHAKVPLTNQLNDWIGDFSSVEKKFIGDREFFRRIEKKPEIINQLFDFPELAKVKAIIWPATSPSTNGAYVKMITLRSLDVVVDRRVFNFTGQLPGLKA